MKVKTVYDLDLVDATVDAKATIQTDKPLVLDFYDRHGGGNFSLEFTPEQFRAFVENMREIQFDWDETLR